MSANQQGRQPVGARRFGYTVAALVNVVLLYLINGRPGWAAVPFLTDRMSAVIALLNASIAAGVVVNLGCVVVDPPWLVAAGSVVTTGLGLVVLIRLWQVFPFDLGAGGNVTIRVLLALAVAGTVAGLVVQVVTLIRAGTGHGAPRSARHSS